MISKIIEASNRDAGGFNWGKFMVARFTDEWLRKPAVRVDGEHMPSSAATPLLARCGWTHDHILVMDLQTGEGALFRPGGYAKSDLDQKHRIWVCPLFEPFLTWLYEQPLGDLAALPAHVTLDAPSAMQGYRRKGGEKADEP